MQMNFPMTHTSFDNWKLILLLGQSRLRNSLEEVVAAAFDTSVRSERQVPYASVHTDKPQHTIPVARPTNACYNAVIHHQ